MFANHQSENTYKPTIGVDFLIKNISILNYNIHLYLWDTSGNITYKTIVDSYFRHTELHVFLFDVTSESSFNSLHDWVKRALDQLSGVTVARFIIGNKNDLIISRKVSFEEGYAIAKRYGVFYMEVCATDYNSLNDAIECMCNHAITCTYINKHK